MSTTIERRRGFRERDEIHINDDQEIQLDDKKVRARSGGSKQWTCILLAILISIPTISLYIGYCIGNALMPPRRKFGDRGVVVDIGRLNYTWYNTHNVTVQFLGGLGNQMFQYASMYGIAKANGLKPIINMDNRIINAFPGVIQKTDITLDRDLGKDYAKFVEMYPNTFDGRTFTINFMKNIILEGFYQSWRYFDHVKADIRKLFTFRSEMVSRAHETLRDMLKEYKDKIGSNADERHPVQFVGVHIRRGDMMEDYNTEKGYTVADTGFIRKAMRYFEETYKNVIFVICTDDRAWSRNNSNTESRSSLVVLSPHHSGHMAMDLCLLSLCNHTIVTVGTYGWWGAWLAGGDVVYFKDFPKPFSAISSMFRHSDYYIPRWIPI